MLFQAWRELERKYSRASLWDIRPSPISGKKKKQKKKQFHFHPNLKKIQNTAFAKNGIQYVNILKGFLLLKMFLL